MYALNSLQSYDFTASFSDPRLISSAHSGQRLVLDAPPLDGGTPMSQVYACRPGYRMNYSNYGDIGGGDVSYYYDASIGQPFIEPLFDNRAAFIKVDYIDPMGTLKPHYYRNANDSCGKGLTWLEDSQRQRNDLIASQLWQRNQSDALLLLPPTQ